MCQEPGLGYSQEYSAHVAVGGGQQDGNGAEDKEEHPFCHAKSVFLRPLPCPPLFPYIFVSPHLRKISATRGSQEIASFLC